MLINETGRDKMPKKLPALITTAVLACFSSAGASAVAVFSDVLQPVLTERNGISTVVENNTGIQVGSRIVTGTGGRAEIELWSDVTLRLYPDSEILLQQKFADEDDAARVTPGLLLLQGKMCLQNDQSGSTQDDFSFNIAEGLQATLFQYASTRICVQHFENQSALLLIEGSVQLTNSIEPGLIILSEPGVEILLSDDGSYELLPPGSADGLVSNDEQPFIDGQQQQQQAVMDVEAAKLPSFESLETPARDETITDAAEPAKQPTTQTSRSYVYTVYLFSSFSEEVTNEVNQNMQQAGLDTRIIISSKELPLRYRIGVSGFVSRDQADAFSDSVTGTLGITDTWIGRSVLPRSDQ